MSNESSDFVRRESVVGNLVELKRGLLEFLPEGRRVPYALVPTSYMKSYRKNSRERVSEVLGLLGLTQPDMFLTSPLSSDPKWGENERFKFKFHMEALLREVSTVCAPGNNIFIVPARGSVEDKLGEFICQACTRDTVRLGLCVSKKKKSEQSSNRSSSNWQKLLKDALFEGDKYPDKVLCVRKPGPSSKSRPHAHNSHVLFFEDESSLEQWRADLEQVATPGLICMDWEVNDKKIFSGWRLVTETIRKGHPLFVFHQNSSENDRTNDKTTLMGDYLAIAVSNKIPAVSGAVPLEHRNLSPPDYANYVEYHKALQTMSMNPASILMINPLQCRNMEMVLDKIMKTMMVGFHTTAELGGNQADRDRLKYVIAVRDGMKKKSDRERFLLRASSICVSVVSVATVVVATLAEGTTYPSQFREYSVLQIMSVACPLIAGFVLKFFQQLNSGKKYATFHLGWKSLEAEIYKYRTNTGLYTVQRFRPENKVPVESISGRAGNNPFTWPTTIDQSLPRGEALAKEVARILSHFQEETPMRVTNFSFENQHQNFSPQDNQPRWVSNQSQERKTRWFAKSSSSIAPVQGQESPSETMRNGKELWKRGKVKVFAAIKIATPNEIKQGLEDESQPLLVEQYVKERLEGQLKKLEYNAWTVGVLVFILNMISLVLSTVAAGMASFGLTRWVPTVFALLGGIQIFIHSTDMNLRNIHLPAAVTELHKLLMWWKGLSVLQKRTRRNRDYLVQTCEAILIEKVRLFSTSMEEKGIPSLEDLSTAGATGHSHHRKAKKTSSSSTATHGDE